MNLASFSATLLNNIGDDLILDEITLGTLGDHTQPDIMNTLTDTMNALTVSTSANAPRLTGLPEELRYRIYVFAFDASTVTLTQRGKVGNAVCASKVHFPIALSATCWLLNTEVKHYLSTLWEGLLVLDTGNAVFRLPRYIPEQYLGRFQTLISSSDVLLYNNIDLDILSNISLIVLALPILTVPFTRDEANTLFEPKKTKERMNKDLLNCIGEAVCLWDNYEALHAVVSAWLAEDIQVRMQFRTCLCNEEAMVHAIVDAEIDCLPEGEEGSTAITPRLLEHSVPLFRVPGYLGKREWASLDYEDDGMIVHRE
jgi:hypothetical protein